MNQKDRIDKIVLLEAGLVLMRTNGTSLKKFQAEAVQ